MTLCCRLTFRYMLIVVLSLLLLAGLAHRELINNPALRERLHIPEVTSHPEPWRRYVDEFFYVAIPVVLCFGWWLMRRTLEPISDLAKAVERIEAHNLREPLPRPGTGDEIDRLTEVFNAMTARLDQSFQQIREFTLHASHELKTPLTIMRAELETALRDDAALTPAQRDRVHSQLDEIERLAKIVDGLTLLTKADAGLVMLERQPVKLHELVRESFEDAQILAEPQQVQVSLAACAEVEIRGDRHRLRQLLLNLVDNAVKYNRPGGTVTIALRRTDKSADIEIVNTGAGIPPELQPRVFDRFVRGTDAPARAADGCGLGLTICRWIAEAHGGLIEICSAPDRPTSAFVRLPLTGGEK